MSEKKKKRKQNRKRVKEILTVVKKYDLVKDMTPDKLEKALAELGPVYIKLGQIMSMRRDLLPKEYCDALLELQTNVNPLPFEVVEEELRTTYNRDPYEIFASIEEVPLGSASIAQTHKAVLHSGEEVVIKVQRPDIYEVMEEDMAILTRAARIFNLVGPKKAKQIIDLEAVLNEMWKAAQNEMNFMVEAQNAQRFKKLNEKIPYFDSPEVYMEYTTPKVLVMNYIPGTDIDKNDLLIKQGYDLKLLSTQLVENYIKQVVEDGFFHADPHPGNLRIHDDQIAWIDMGMMGNLTESQKKFFKKAIKAIAFNDINNLESAFLGIGIENGPVDEIKLHGQLEKILEEYGSMDITELDIEKFFEDIIAVFSENNISMPSDITMLFRGLITIESVVTNLAPSINLVSIAKKYLSDNKSFQDIKEELVYLTRETAAAGKASLKIPVNLSDFLNLLLKGNAKINIAITGSEEPLAAIAKMVNRLVIGIITAALLIGSSFISTTNMNPKILGIPALGIIGFLGSAVLGFWIVIQMLNQDKKFDKK